MAKRGVTDASLLSAHAAEGTYGKTSDGFAVTDSLPMPSICRDTEHHVRCIVRQRAAVPLREAKRGASTDLIWENVGEEAVGHFCSISVGILGGLVGRDNTGDRFRNRAAIGREIVSRTARIESITEVQANFPPLARATLS
jgi:hypothetical protein